MSILHENLLEHFNLPLKTISIFCVLSDYFQVPVKLYCRFEWKSSVKSYLTSITFPDLFSKTCTPGLGFLLLWLPLLCYSWLQQSHPLAVPQAGRTLPPRPHTHSSILHFCQFKHEVPPFQRDLGTHQPFYPLPPMVDPLWDKGCDLLLRPQSPGSPSYQFLCSNLLSHPEPSLLIPSLEWPPLPVFSFLWALSCLYLAPTPTLPPSSPLNLRGIHRFGLSCSINSCSAIPLISLWGPGLLLKMCTQNTFHLPPASVPTQPHFSGDKLHHWLPDLSGNQVLSRRACSYAFLMKKLKVSQLIYRNSRSHAKVFGLFIQ